MLRGASKTRSIVAVCAAVLLCAVAAALALSGDSSPTVKTFDRVDLKTTLPDGSGWTGSIYLKDSGRSICMTSPARDGAHWGGPGCLTGGFLTNYFKTKPPALISAVGVVYGTDGRRNAVVYGYADSRWRVTKVTSDGIKADAIRVSSRMLGLSKLVLRPFVAVIRLGTAPGEAFLWAVGPDRQEHRQHIYP